jgi:hypothetical protein
MEDVLQLNLLICAAKTVKLLDKISQILKFSDKSILKALKTVAQNQQKQWTEAAKDTKVICNIIELVEATTLLDDLCKELQISIDPKAIEDESSESHGWFASIKNAFFHPIEFVKKRYGVRKKSIDLIAE